MSARAVAIVRELLEEVPVDEIVLSQVKRQIDDSQANGKPMLPLWADRVAFQFDHRGKNPKLVTDHYKRKVRTKDAARKRRKLRKMIRQLKRVTGAARKYARLALRALRAKSRMKTKRGTMRTRGSGDSARPPRPGERFYSYRRGGKPLLDTRQGYAAIHAEQSGEYPQYEVTIKAPSYMCMQHAGFTSEGKHFIALSQRARRIHRTGENPTKEGLIRGKDYWILGRVSIPARPFAKLGPSYMRRVAKSVAMSMRANG